MRTIRVIEQISLDGVIQAPGGRNEDGDYAYGGWAMPFFDPVIGEAIIAAQGEHFDLLLGRRTYDIFAGYWPTAQDNALAKGLNAATKYVATHRPETLAWGPAEGLGADIAAGIASIKSNNGPDLIVWGSSTLTPMLLAQGLADEVVLLVCPVLLGGGKRFFPEGAAARELALISTKASGSGVLINTYGHVGSLQPQPSFPG